MCKTIIHALPKVSFGACTAGSSTVTSFGVHDALSAGNLLAYGTCSLAVGIGITPSFAVGQLTTTAD